MSAATYHRLGLALGVGTLVVLVWSVGALGVVGPGGPADRWYLLVPATALVGAAAARLRPRGMALAAVATVLAQVVAGVLSLVTGWGDVASLADVVMVNAFFVALLGAAAWLFARAAARGR